MTSQPMGADEKHIDIFTFLTAPYSSTGTGRANDARFVRQSYMYDTPACAQRVTDVFSRSIARARTLVVGTVHHAQCRRFLRLVRFFLHKSDHARSALLCIASVSSDCLRKTIAAAVNRVGNLLVNERTQCTTLKQ